MTCKERGTRKKRIGEHAEEALREVGPMKVSRLLSSLRSRGICVASHDSLRKALYAHSGVRRVNPGRIGGAVVWAATHTPMVTAVQAQFCYPCKEFTDHKISASGKTITHTCTTCQSKKAFEVNS